MQTLIHAGQAGSGRRDVGNAQGSRQNFCVNDSSPGRAFSDPTRYLDYFRNKKSPKRRSLGLFVSSIISDRNHRVVVQSWHHDCLLASVPFLICLVFGRDRDLIHSLVIGWAKANPGGLLAPSEPDGLTIPNLSDVW